MAASLPVISYATTVTGRESPFVDLRGKSVGEYSVKEWIHGGSRVDIFRGTDADGKHVAIKVATVESAADRLHTEYHVTKFLTSRKAPVPHPRALFTHGTVVDGGQFYRVMVMDYLPSTLEGRLRNPETMPHGDVLRIAREAIIGLSAIHWRSVILGDITERNLAFDKEDKLAFIGFGQALHRVGLAAVSDEIDDKKVWQIEVTYRADLRALALVLVSLAGAEVPKLPKNPLAEQRSIFHDSMNNVDIDALMCQLPEASLGPLKNLISHAYALGFKEMPDYNRLRQAFEGS